MPDSIIFIGEEAFKECSSLTDLTMPAGHVDIGLHAFYNCPTPPVTP
jgi:hypothetical protein